ncbi:MAG: septal ring lytic transglycosylase RlpA family protein [Methyloprofundus sp.]|nr:septal ring lytic transglycosylase RlpA family protein [Methyloprofundus sp.]
MKALSFLICTALLLGCTKKSEKILPPVNIVDGKPDFIPVDIAAIPDVVPQFEPYLSAEDYIIFGKTYQVLKDNTGFKQQGIASWYGTKFQKKTTATGDVYDMFKLTAAHKTLPIPSYARVTNLENQRSIIVRINDRGPFHDHRVIDLSYAAAVKLGIDKLGTGFVDIAAVQVGEVSSSAGIVVAKKVYYQIGAFSTEENALLLQAQIKAEQLLKSRISAVKTAAGTFYKLQLGPISSVSEADHIALVLEKLGLVGGYYLSE